MEQMKSYIHGCILKAEYNLGKQTMHDNTEQTPGFIKLYQKYCADLSRVLVLLQQIQKSLHSLWC